MPTNTDRAYARASELIVRWDQATPVILLTADPPVRNNGHDADWFGGYDPEATAFLRRADLIAVAMKQGHVILRCGYCPGPVIMATSHPYGQCLRCKRIRRVRTMPDPVRRWQCEQCHGFYRARVGRRYCPACQTSRVRHGQI